MTVVKKFIETTTRYSEKILGKSAFVAGFLVIWVCQLTMGYVHVGADNANNTYKYAQNISNITVAILTIFSFLGIYMPLFLESHKHLSTLTAFIDFAKPYLFYNFGLAVFVYFINIFVSDKPTGTQLGKIGEDTKRVAARNGYSTFVDSSVNSITKTLESTAAYKFFTGDFAAYFIPAIILTIAITK